jgi:Fic family protein
MELPIFSDNLKSSASWVDLLAREQQRWRQASTKMDAETTEPLIRKRQIQHLRAWSGEDIREAHLLDAARRISDWAMLPQAKLTHEQSIEIYRTLVGAPEGQDVLRKTEPVPLNPMHDPAPAVIVPRMLENAFDWFSVESFAELHPVERASVVFLRLLDLHPFPTAPRTTALLLASFYTESAGFPPLIISSDPATTTAFGNALDAAFRMLTQPLVELFARMLIETMTLATVEEPEEPVEEEGKR